MRLRGQVETVRGAALDPNCLPCMEGEVSMGAGGAGGHWAPIPPDMDLGAPGNPCFCFLSLGGPFRRINC